MWDRDLDDAERYVSVLGLIGRDGTVGQHAESTVVLPESVGVLDALWRLQAARRQLALVVSEHGAVEGIVSVEDLVEEIVGEIYDEHDRDLVGVVRHDDGTIDLPGRFPLHDLVDLRVRAPERSEQTTDRRVRGRARGATARRGRPGRPALPRGRGDRGVPADRAARPA